MAMQEHNGLQDEPLGELLRRLSNQVSELTRQRLRFSAGPSTIPTSDRRTGAMPAKRRMLHSKDLTLCAPKYQR